MEIRKKTGAQQYQRKEMNEFKDKCEYGSFPSLFIGISQGFGSLIRNTESLVVSSFEFYSCDGGGLYNVLAGNLS